MSYKYFSLDLTKEQSIEVLYSGTGEAGDVIPAIE
jgi:hypothetical protein